VKSATEICHVKESLSASIDVKPAIIYELNTVDIIPLQFYNYENKKKTTEIIEKICKFLGQGFFYAVNFDLTTNAQRRATRPQVEEHMYVGSSSSVDIKYMWNFNLC
jgi:hypothetical protein